MNSSTQLLKINGIELNVLLAGPENGPPVLLLHGFPDDHTVWRHQIPELVKAGYRVIAPDTRGTGDSELLPKVSDYGMKHLVADQIALLDYLGLKKVRLVAHDWGAIQGWALVLRYPERFDRYMALSVGHPWCYTRAGWQQKQKGWYVYFFQTGALARWICSLNDWNVFRYFLRFESEWPHIKQQYSRPGRFAAGQNYYVSNLRKWHAAPPTPAQIPVMGVYSTADIALVEKQMTLSEKLCPKGWRYERLEGVGHWMTLEAPDRVTALMLDYLKSSL
jgi:pimeloyl-ACP methyl ester carboxylesterase